MKADAGLEGYFEEARTWDADRLAQGQRTLLLAVAIAGAFSPRAYRREAKVARAQNGQSYRLAVPPTYSVLPGDTITIEERWF